MELVLYAMKTPSKKTKLYHWLIADGKKHFRSSEIQEWGTKSFTVEPTRLARKLATEGKLRRLSKTEAVLSGFNTREGIWEVL